MSQLSRRDLSRMDETSELLSGGESKFNQDDNAVSKITKINYYKPPLQSADHDDYFFSHVT